MSLKRKPSGQKISASSTAVLAGMCLTMIFFCIQAKAHNARLFGAARSDSQIPAVHPKLWPESKSPIGLDAKVEERIDNLLSRMTVE
jgi:hypothetical protein